MRMKFSAVALGARFTYIDGEDVWIKMFDDSAGYGLIAAYDPKLIMTSGWNGQQLCSAKDNLNDDLYVDVIA